MDAIELSLFTHQLGAVCDEMGTCLQQTAFSANIKERLDYSCAIFDQQGHLCAQAAHIPVHLGSMAYAMQSIIGDIDWHEGDSLLINDPYRGGTHLPDVTLITPLFFHGSLTAFLVNRAHYADIGAETPGSMPLASSLAEEGLLISGIGIERAGVIDEASLNDILDAVQNPSAVKADLLGQISANQLGQTRLTRILHEYGRDAFLRKLIEVNRYASDCSGQLFNSLPQGRYEFSDYLDGDGYSEASVTLKVAIDVQTQGVQVDFSGTDPQVVGNLNCPLSVTAAAVYYCFYCLMPDTTPACAGAFERITLQAPKGSVLNAEPPAAVAAGNVETSSRVVDVMLGALAKAIPERIPAASQGTMNNIAMGNDCFSYYETLAGGMGGSAINAGLDAVQCHMTNTANTPVEVLESHMPLRITEYALRRHSGGAGSHRGGYGLVREYQFLANSSVSLLTERRQHTPWGLNGGSHGAQGINTLNDKPLPGKGNYQVSPGDRLRIATPGGGGWGKHDEFA